MHQKEPIVDSKKSNRGNYQVDRTVLTIAMFVYFMAHGKLYLSIIFQNKMAMTLALE